jgi:hypothetical protein
VRETEGLVGETFSDLNLYRNRSPHQHPPVMWGQ